MARQTFFVVISTSKVSPDGVRKTKTSFAIASELALRILKINNHLETPNLLPNPSITVNFVPVLFNCQLSPSLFFLIINSDEDRN